MNTQLIAHRGASRDAPENTRAAFLRAVEVGSTMIELDVQLTADDRLVVIHDQRIDRTANSTGAVRDLTVAELRQFSYDSSLPGVYPSEDVGILELREAVDFMVEHNLDLNVETKEHGAAAERVNDLVAATLRDAGWSERTLVSSINHAASAAMKAQHPEIRTAIAFVERFVDLTDYARSCGADVLHPHYGLVDAEFVERARDGGFGINAWTVDEPDDVRRLIALGIDGVMTNRPDLLSDGVA